MDIMDHGVDEGFFFLTTPVLQYSVQQCQSGWNPRNGSYSRLLAHFGVYWEKYLPSCVCSQQQRVSSYTDSYGYPTILVVGRRGFPVHLQLLVSSYCILIDGMRGQLLLSSYSLISAREFPYFDSYWYPLLLILLLTAHLLPLCL